MDAQMNDPIKITTSNEASILIELNKAGSYSANAVRVINTPVGNYSIRILKVDADGKALQYSKEGVPKQLSTASKKKLQAAKSRLAFLEANHPKVIAMAECGLSTSRELENSQLELERTRALVKNLEEGK